MAQKITIANLQRVCDRLNEITGAPKEAWRRELDAPHNGIAKEKGETRPYTFKANVGNYHLCEQYGGVSLHRMENESGGVRDVLRIGYVSRRELYNAMFAFIEGIYLGRGEQNK
jgi:hypothetical protein